MYEQLFFSWDLRKKHVKIMFHNECVSSKLDYDVLFRILEKSGWLAGSVGDWRMST